MGTYFAAKAATAGERGSQVRRADTRAIHNLPADVSPMRENGNASRSVPPLQFSFANMPLYPPEGDSRRIAQRTGPRARRPAAGQAWNAEAGRPPGLPKSLREGIERLSGLPMGDVRVHYNSLRPARLDALAYARGSEIHLAPGQERTLPHEAWHLVQQARGRVKPTMRMDGGVPVNDDPGLEREADRMGSRALRMHPLSPVAAWNPVAAGGQGGTPAGPVSQPARGNYSFGRMAVEAPSGGAIQRKPVPPEEARGIHNSLGSQKWREFIDAQHHAEAERETEQGHLADPGEYYNYKRVDGNRVNMGPQYQNFLNADDFVNARLGKALTPDEYLHIQRLATAGLSPFLQGWREDPVTWGLPSTASEHEQGQLRQKGLQVEPDTGRFKVTVPVPAEHMQAHVGGLLKEYYAKQQKTEEHSAKFLNIVELYQKLESIHPFKEGTSRTNHLVLNKLLSEHGLGPAILDQPNSPGHSTEDFARVVLAGIARGRDTAKTQDSSSSEGLAKARLGRAKDRELELRLAQHPQYGKGSGSGVRQFRPPTTNDDVLSEGLDLEGLQKHFRRPSPAPQKPTPTPRALRSISATPQGGPDWLDQILLTKVMGRRKAEEYAELKYKQERRKQSGRW
jgi:hypothetical protein